MANIKTNAMRILDKNKASYNMRSYDCSDGVIDGLSVATKIQKDPKIVFKTLVAQGVSRGLYVFVIPVCDELDLKKAAKAANEKKIELIPVKDITKHTGYIRGGCSPIGMKKLYPTYIDSSAEDNELIIFSGGKIGVQIEMNPLDLCKIVNAKFTELKF